MKRYTTMHAMNESTEKLITGVILGARSYPATPPPDAIQFLSGYIRQQKERQASKDQPQQRRRNIFPVK